MTDKLGLSFLTSRKERKVYSGEDAWFTFEWEHQLLNETVTSHVAKSWQPGNELKEYARWMVATPTSANYDSMGARDAYVRDMLATPYRELLTVDGEPATDEQKTEFELFAMAVSRTPAPSF